MPCQYTSRQELPARVCSRLPDGVSPAVRSRARSQGIALLAAALLAGWTGHGPAMVGGASTPSTGSIVVTVILGDGVAARELATALPVTVEMEDRFGQAKTGALASELTTVGADYVRDPVPGHLYYWPPERTIAVFTGDLGPSIPEPGLLDLGVVDRGLENLTARYQRFQMTLAPTG